MNETVTSKGKPLTLAGNQLKSGDKMPEFELVAPDLKRVKSDVLKGKVAIIATVPCLATSVCDTMTRRFNEEASKLGSEVSIVTVSMDLPFAQKIWCAGAGIERLQVLSDHLEGKFGKAFGVLINDWRMLARSVFVVDANGIVRHCHVVKELSEQPNYDEVLSEAKKLIKT